MLEFCGEKMRTDICTEQKSLIRRGNYEFKISITKRQDQYQSP